MMRFDLVSLRASDGNKRPGIRLTSDAFWVDRSEVPAMLKKAGAEIIKCDWDEVLFSVDGDREKFVEIVCPQIMTFARNL